MKSDLASILKAAHTVRSQSESPEVRAFASDVLALFTKAPPQESRAVAEGGWVNAALVAIRGLEHYSQRIQGSVKATKKGRR